MSSSRELSELGKHGEEGLVIVVNSFTDLRALPVEDGQLAYFNVDGYRGIFKKVSEDVSANVALDTFGYTFITLTSEDDGSTGAWQRVSPYEVWNGYADYRKYGRVWHEGTMYVSKVDSNIETPSATATNWDEV